jgi:hypothetical protein
MFMCFDDWSSISLRQEVLTPAVDVNAGRPRTVRTPANEDVITAAVERKPTRSSREFARELGLSQPRVLGVIPLLAERTSTSRLSSSTDAIL